MSHTERDAYRALPARQRRAVRRAARRGRRGRFDAALAGPLLAFAHRRQRRARPVLVLAVAVILASAAGAAAVVLRSGPDPLLAVPAAGLLIGGVAGVVSERRLRRAEEAEALAASRLRAAPRPAAPARAAAPAPTPAPVQPVDGDAARRRLARLLSGRPRTDGEPPSGHPWD